MASRIRNIRREVKYGRGLHGELSDWMDASREAVLRHEQLLGLGEAAAVERQR